MANEMLLNEVARLLVDASAIEVTTDRDTSVEVWTISASGATIRASAPRLEVAEQMQVSTRHPVQGVPHVVTLVIEKAEVQSETRAALMLRIVSVQPDGYQRQSERHTLAATATLTAVVCGRVVPGEQVAASVTDLSETGAGLKTTDARPRPPDLMHLYCRFLEGAIDCDIRIMRAANEPGGTYRLGCVFTDPPPATIDLVRRVLLRLTGTHRPA
jgi:hypothetical protein